MTAKKTDDKLSPLGQKAEAVLKKRLEDMDRDMTTSTKAGTDPKYSLTDTMKVLDRVIKIEAIRAKMKDDDEGEFFNNPEEGANEDD